MTYNMVDYAYDEPAFTGTVRAAMCDNHRDVLGAVEDYEAKDAPHYLIMTQELAEEFEAWVSGFRALLWKQQLNRISTIIASGTLIGLPMALVKTKLHIDGLNAKIAERRGFYACYIANNYKYKDGCVGVNLAKFSRPGLRLQKGKAPL